MLDVKRYYSVACVAWRFWLGALSNKGGWGQRNCKEIGVGATWKTACTDRGLFRVGPYASVRIVPMFVHQSNILVISHGRVSRDWTNHCRKTKSKYQRSVDQSVIDLEYLTGKQGNCIDQKHKQEMPFTVFLKGEMSWKFCQQVLARAWSCFAMAKEEISS